MLHFIFQIRSVSYKDPFKFKKELVLFSIKTCTNPLISISFWPLISLKLHDHNNGHNSIDCLPPSLRIDFNQG